MPSRGQSCIIKYWAWNGTVGAYQSGDAGNHNLNLYKDATKASPTNAATEPDATNTPGLYYVALTSAEATFNTVTIAGKSSTASVSLFGQTIAFEQLPVPSFATAGGLLTYGSGAGQINTTVSGAADSNLLYWQSVAPSALTAGAVQTNVTTYGGQTALTNAGLPIVTTALSGSPGGVINANLVSISGHAVSLTSAGYLGVDVEQWQGLTVSTHISGIPDVNTLYWDGVPAQVDDNNLPKVDVEDIIGGSVSQQVADQIVTVVAVASGAAVSTPNLGTYLTDLQNLLGVGGATTQNLYTSAQLVSYINKARLQVAQQGQCVRVLTPISNQISSITVVSGGQNYTNSPTFMITQPDSPAGAGPLFAGQAATATATVSGGSVVAVSLTNGGAGYFQPVVTLVSGGGFGATAIAVISGVAQTNTFQEVYPFSQFNPLVAQPNSGVDRIVQLFGISTIWGTFRYTLIHKSFSAYQAYARTYTAGYYYIPTVWTQYGQGTNGSFYMYPIPNQAYQLELDCICRPIQLNTNTDVEAIPGPWNDAVIFLAAYYAYLGSQRMSDAEKMMGEYEKWMIKARQEAQAKGIVNPYGRA